MFVQRKGKQRVIQCYLIPVEPFIRAESAPGGLMWSHGATTNTERIQRGNQTYFLPLKLPAEPALFHLEIHPLRYNTMFVMIVQLHFHMRNFTKYSPTIFCVALLSLLKCDFFFSLLFWRKNHFILHFQLLWYNPALPRWVLRSHCPSLFVLFIVKPRCPLQSKLRHSFYNCKTRALQTLIHISCMWIVKLNL